MPGSRALDPVAVALASLSAAVAYLVSTQVFPYLSTNHDEGVYLQQAEMLLEGRLVMHAGDLVEFFRPWFFVVDGGMMYPKYTPVPALVFAAGEALGGFSLALAAVAFAVVLLTYLVVSEAWNPFVGAVASASLLLSPLFVVQSGLFLPYAPTAAFNLGMAYGYLRAHREHAGVGPAVAAGVCGGVAFFSRPYTAVLFAVPFAVHAAYAVYESHVDAGHGVAESLRRYTYMAAPGLVLLVVTLAYNQVMTGDALVFPYLEFAPDDGLGFGERSILGYTRVYDPALAVEANSRVLWSFLWRWGPGSAVGSVVAAAGVWRIYLEPDWRKVVVAGVAVSVAVGNLFFWGNLNVLGDISDPADGLVHLYGPLYHFDLLLPASALFAAGVVYVYRGMETRFDGRRAAAVASVVVVAAVAAGGGAVADSLDHNAAVSESYEVAYEPFEERGSMLDGGLVFLPTPYGPWLNHPLQHLRNSPSLDGETVYAMDRGGDSFRVVDAYPERDLFRYGYRGEWRPQDGEAVQPKLERLRVVKGDAVVLETKFEVPEEATGVSASLDGDRDVVGEVEVEGGEGVVRWGVDGDTGFLLDGSGDRLGEVEVGSSDEISLDVDVALRYDSFRIRQELVYEAADGGVRVLAPPYTEVCYSSSRCGGEAALVPSLDVDVETEVIGGVPGSGP